MRIVMSDGKSTIEWTIVRAGKNFVARQTDKLGIHRIPFATVDLAGAWIISQVNYVRAEMPEYKFTDV